MVRHSSSSSSPSTAEVTDTTTTTITSANTNTHSSALRRAHTRRRRLQLPASVLPDDEIQTQHEIHGDSVRFRNSTMHVGTPIGPNIVNTTSLPVSETDTSKSPSNTDCDRIIITQQDWSRRLQATNVDRVDMDALVLNYLVIHGYKDAADHFCHSARIQANKGPLSSIENRVAIKRAVIQGNIDDAVRQVNAYSPRLLDESPVLLFGLLKQKLIEIVRSRDLEQALLFAKNELAPRAAQSDVCLAALEQCMALFAFADAEKSPVANLMSLDKRVALASQLNAFILKKEFASSEPKLCVLLKRLSYFQKLLSANVDFPITTDLFNFVSNDEHDTHMHDDEDIGATSEDIHEHDETREQ